MRPSSKNISTAKTRSARTLATGINRPAGMYTIVGVVENAQYWPPNDTQERGHPMYFLPAWQWAQLPASTPKASLYAEFLTATHYMSSLEIETNGTVPDLEGG